LKIKILCHVKARANESSRVRISEALAWYRRLCLVSQALWNRSFSTGEQTDLGLMVAPKHAWYRRRIAGMPGIAGMVSQACGVFATALKGDTRLAAWQREQAVTAVELWLQFQAEPPEGGTLQTATAKPASAAATSRANHGSETDYDWVQQL